MQGWSQLVERLLSVLPGTAPFSDWWERVAQPPLALCVTTLFQVFRNMSHCEITGNFPVALTQYFAGDSSLNHGITVSAFPSSSHSDSDEMCAFEA